jgi:anti-anti-sigma factor
MGMDRFYGQIHIRTGGPVNVVALQGEHDHVSKSQLERIVETLLDDPLARAVIFDLSNTDFVNLPVLGTLTRATERAGRDKHVIVVLPEVGSPIVRRLFDVTDAEKRLHVVPTMEDAVAAARQEPGRETRR